MLLSWILEQITLGHLSGKVDDDGEVVGLEIGHEVPTQAPSQKKAAEEAWNALNGVQFAGTFARARERGTDPASLSLVKEGWDAASPSAYRRMEIHYAQEFCQLLGRISKKLPSLELLPILGIAPDKTKDYLAEATRCHLLKLDRACVALCRACLEDALRSTLTEPMRTDWEEEIDKNRRNHADPSRFYALIVVCGRHGVLGDLEPEAHRVRKRANETLHPEDGKEIQTSDLAREVLHNTRRIIAWIHGQTPAPAAHADQRPAS